MVQQQLEFRMWIEEAEDVNKNQNLELLDVE